VRTLLAFVLLAGCTGNITDKSLAGLTPQEALAKQRWLGKAEPVFKAKCVMCHDGSMATATPPADPYLVGATDMEIRDTAVAYIPQLVNLGAPASSRVLTKGSHEGPEMTAQEATDVLSWITAERDARPPVMTIETMPVMMMAGPAVTTVPLDSLGYAGATISLTAMPINGSDTYVTGITITAGADGLYLQHPLFVSNPTDMDPVPDPIDRFYSTTLDLMPAGSAPLTSPATTYTGFNIGNPLSVRFDVLDKYRAGM
jgi:hypothetical protein